MKGPGEAFDELLLLAACTEMRHNPQTKRLMMILDLVNIVICNLKSEDFVTKKKERNFRKLKVKVLN